MTDIAIHDLNDSYTGEMAPFGIESTREKLDSRHQIIAVEAFAVLRHILPNALAWRYREDISGQITRIILEATAHKVTKTANMFRHGSIHLGANGEVSAVLMLPGEQSHPYSLLHLADIAQSEGKAVFSAHLPYDCQNPNVHRALLNQTIEKIESMIKERGGTLHQLTVAGHSRGAIEAAYAAYVDDNPKITSVISMFSRLRVIEPSLKPCREELKATVNAVYENIMKKSTPPLYQMSAERDWNADREASQVKPENHLLVKGSCAMHLYALFFPETLQQFREWIRA